MPATLPLADAQRQILWNVSSIENQVVMYALFALSMVVFAWGVWSRVLIWAGGAPDPTRFGALARRAKRLWDYVLCQRATVRSRAAALFHTLILTGFMVLLFTTTMVFIHHDLGWEIYRGRFYLAVTILSDLFGLLLLAGVLIAAHRRYVRHPDLLHNAPGALLVLLLLALMVVQGFGLEALRIAVTRDPWAPYSFIGYGVSLLFWGIPPEGLRALHFGLWWFHTITVFIFIALLPYTKFLHIITSSANLYFARFDRPKGALPYPGDMDSLMEAALADESGEFSIGVSTIKDFTWKQRLDLDACTECGRCQDMCPAYNSGKILSPKWLIIDSRNHMLKLRADGKLPVPFSFGSAGELLAKLDRWLLARVFLPSLDLSTGAREVPNPARAANPLVQHSAGSIGTSLDEPIADGVMHQDVFWACTTCRACMEFCPVGIEHVDLITEVRRSMTLMEGKLPAEAQTSLRAIETRGNPFGPAESRSDWMEGLNVRLLEAGDEVEVLYWVGCVSAYDRRKQRIARSVATILNAAGLSWGMLGNRESCTGDPARRLGEENQFQSQAKKNIATLQSVRFRTIVANCPHCFNTIRNEYPTIGSLSENAEPVRVIHHSQLISELIRDKRLSLRDGADEELTFHDPCYLGRYNDNYDEPRDVLVQLGKRVKEMDESRERGMCCGAGGGHFWMDMKVGERINVRRVAHARATGVATVATGCPFCLQMLEDGVKMTEDQAPLAVQDIAELVAAQLEAPGE